MKKYSLLLFFIFLFVYNNVFANIKPVRIDPNTFILNAQNDLGKIQVKGSYYIPTPGYEYDNVEGVKSQMLLGLDYDNEFYKTRHITPDVVNGTDPYKYIDWEKPIVVKSLGAIKSKLKGFLFAYRRPDGIFWMDGADFTESFFSGYGSPSNQTVILYPIKEKSGKNKGKLLGFMEYPCGNLVCRDSNCSDLIPKPICGDGILNVEKGEQCDPKDPNTKNGCTNTCQWKKLSCSVKIPSFNYNQTTNITGINIKKDVGVNINTFIINNKVYKGDNVLNDIKNIGKLPPGKYKIQAIGTNIYNNEYIICEPRILNVNNKEWCGDGIVQKTEECDYNDKNSGLGNRCTKTCKLIDICGDGIKTGNEECDYAIPGMEKLCTKTCKLSDVSCKVTVEPNTFVQGNSLQKDYFKIETIGKLLDTGYFNKFSMSLNNIYNKVLDVCGIQEITFLVKNPYKDDGIIKKCSVKINVVQKEFCGDGIVQKTEECDPKNGVNGIACENNCKLKRPSCEIIDILPNYQLGDNVVFGIKNDSYGKIMSITSGTIKGNIINGTNLGNIKFTKTGNYDIKVGVQNIFDKTGRTYNTCKTNISIINKQMCPIK